MLRCSEIAREKIITNAPDLVDQSPMLNYIMNEGPYVAYIQRKTRINTSDVLFTCQTIRSNYICSLIALAEVACDGTV